MQRNFASKQFSYVVLRELEKEGAFDEVLKSHPEIEVFLHTASPFDFNIDEPEEKVLLPALNGVRNVLSAIHKNAPQIKRVVYTSSYAAMIGREVDPDFVTDETIWSSFNWDKVKSNAIFAYLASKTFAEQAAWKFMAEHKTNFELTTVNPTYVFGPQAFDTGVKETLNTSSEIIGSLLKLQADDDIPQNQGGYVDVRDVAKAHLVAFRSPAAIGQRLLVSSFDRFSTYQVLEIIRTNFPILRDRLPVPQPGEHEDAIESYCKMDPSKSWAILGFKRTELTKMVTDTVDQILRVKAI